MVKISEYAEQVAFFEWAKLNMDTYPQLVNMFAIPNGGQRSMRTGAMLKREGVRAGVPDIFLAYPCNGYHGLFVELKRRNDLGVISDAQRDWIDRLNAVGYRAVVCHGAKEAREEVVEYLKCTQTLPDCSRLME